MATPKENTQPSKDLRTITYALSFEGSEEHLFPVHFENKTFDIVPEPMDAYPAWTNLLSNQCPNCPLDAKTHKHCPIAVNIIKPIDFFCRSHPSNNVKVRVETPERTYRHTADLKTAAYSLLGIYMSSSGCPIMDKLRPMARFHLPFATAMETTYRSLANYLIAQYLFSLSNQSPDWKLERLAPIYDEIGTVNVAFHERLKEVSKHNYALNAVLMLDSFANFINVFLSNDFSYDIENLFNYAQEDPNRLPPPTEDPKAALKDALTYEYHFHIENKEPKSFPIFVDRQSLRLINTSEAALPAWTELSCHKCPNCPLDEQKHKHCPAAGGIAGAIEFFRQTVSTEKADITVKTPERDYTKRASISDGISAMMGLLMATSGCPILGRLRPLARMHLPFASNDETVYRALGMYLLSQHFLSKKGGQPDWELKDFTKLYEDINIVNRAFCARLKNSPIEDASLNALVKLDCFAQMINFSVSKDNIDELNSMFRAYFETGPENPE